LFTGYIGLEVAASCAARNMNPAVVMMEPHVMARLWSPEIAAHYENLYESKGTTFHKNAKVKAINKGSDGAVESVELEGGVSIPADLVIVGVGAGAVTAPFDALEGTPERFPGGIKVDGTFAASGAGVEPKSVYAIGDIAAFPLAFDGNQIVRMEHVAHARASATHAAECILADSETPYAYTPYFYSRVFEQVSFYFDLRMGD
jgi:monodehydroascorbate reductase (NADH)